MIGGIDFGLSSTTWVLISSGLFVLFVLGFALIWMADDGPAMTVAGVLTFLLLGLFFASCWPANSVMEREHCETVANDLNTKYHFHDAPENYCSFLIDGRYVPEDQLREHQP